MPELKNPRQLSDRVAIVTGAASGIGAASARVLGAAGARIACADLDAAGAESVAKQIQQAGGEAFGIALDVSDPDANTRVADAIQDRYGALHLAHLNAGIAASSSVLDTTLEEWDAVMNVNLRGVFLSLQATARAIVASGGGAIVGTSSGAGLQGGGNMGTYSASKHGVLGLVKCAAVDLAPSGVRVNAVCPGVIDTPILGPIHGNKEITEGLLGRIHPIGRVGQPEEVGQLVRFLVSEEASFITGSAIPVDGGLSGSIGGFGPGGIADGSIDLEPST